MLPLRMNKRSFDTEDVFYGLKKYFIVLITFVFAGCDKQQNEDAQLFYEWGPPPIIWMTNKERSLLLDRKLQLDKDIRLQMIESADAALNFSPNPTDSIFYEGLVSNHPRRVEMKPHFQDIDNLVYLIDGYILTERSDYRKKSIEIMTAWAGTYKPTGNDVNENKLAIFYYAFDIYREFFRQKEKELITSWLIEIAEQQIKHWDIEVGSSNRHAKRMKLILMAGLVFDKKEYVDLAFTEIKRILDSSLYEDGSSRDLERRDALHYHNSQIKNYLILNYLTRFIGVDIYSDQQISGGSLKKSVHYMFPFIRQEKVHPEWVNTKIELDRERYEAGDDYYKPGKPWDIREGYTTLILSSPFDPECIALIDKLEKMDSLEDRRWLKFQVGIVKEVLEQE